MSAGAGGLPPEAYALALAALPSCGDQRLVRLLGAAGGDAERAWRALAGHRGSTFVDDPAEALGRGGAGLVAAWREVAATTDVSAGWRRAVAAGIGVVLRGREGYPERLIDDPDPPALLCWRGDVRLLASRRPAVAIVGTRRCTAYGVDVARDLGRDLAASGVTVVSGLALGIDGAAHEGALVARDGAPPVGVVGSGLDVVYPPRHRTLWRRVADVGVLVSEAPPGGAPEPWRFPRRNRILAGLVEVVVVVESHASGGSLSTVRAAAERGITVMAVPGSVRSPSSAGTNRLLADGVAPVTDVDDVLVALSLEGAVPPRPLRPPDPDDDPLLAAVDWTPTATEDVLRRTGLTVSEVATRLTRLEVQGLVRRRGGWWERAGEPEVTTDGGYTRTT